MVYIPLKLRVMQPELILKEANVGTLKTQTVVNRLNNAFPKIDGICCGEEMGYGEGTIFLGDAAEGGEIDGNYACYYNGWDADPEEKIWIMGVHRKLFDLLGKCGFHAECYDPGTYIAYRD